MNILITGGAGFIGAALVRHLIRYTYHTIINVDKLTYAGNLSSLSETYDSPRHHFYQVDICDQTAITSLMNKHQPDAIMHLAAESHVDRSIDGPADFIATNVVGTCALLEAARNYWGGLDSQKKAAFRFHHISTDEVYGDLTESGLFTETTPYEPSSPYSASKASSDHLVRAWHRTYGLPVLITNCSNNYGHYQFPEKLIPLMILNALDGKPLPVYGKGHQIRDWLHVDDHVRALVIVLEQGRVGETYNIGGHNEHKNIDIVKAICRILDELKPSTHPGINHYEQLITFVKDRPGHDHRYAIDARKMQTELGWTPEETFESGIYKTIHWYLDNPEWCHDVQTGNYQRQRLGVNL